MDSIEMNPDNALQTLVCTADSTDERRRRKKLLAATLRVIAKHGHGDGAAGHVSVRDAVLTDCMWMNPFGASFYSIGEDDLILLASDGRVLEGKGECQPSTAALHLEIQRSRPEVTAIAHAHTVFATAMSAAGTLLKPISIDACVFRNEQMLFDEFRYGEDMRDAAIRFASELGHRSVGVWRAHGIWSVGRTLESALWKLLAYERACQIQVYSSLIGPAKEIPAELAGIPGDIEVLAHLSGGSLYDSIRENAQDAQNLIYR
ncbi:class II aldolase/adducin family protein [Paraburkholderia kururiensis]|uniref:class II aldolase/adducin family protein n=1 Tax=Paraburkholderia kururiensis TaxID=984307 RepID=UPI0039A54055